MTTVQAVPPPFVEDIWEPSDLYYADIRDSSGFFDNWDRDGNGHFGEICRGTAGDEPGAPGINWDEIDYHPEVAIGRIPADSVEEVQNYVAKVIRYEYLTAGASWFQNMTFSISHDPGHSRVGSGWGAGVLLMRQMTLPVRLPLWASLYPFKL